MRLKNLAEACVAASALIVLANCSGTSASTSAAPAVEQDTRTGATVSSQDVGGFRVVPQKKAGCWGLKVCKVVLASYGDGGGEINVYSTKGKWLGQFGGGPGLATDKNGNTYASYGAGVGVFPLGAEKPSYILRAPYQIGAVSASSKGDVAAVGSYASAVSVILYKAGSTTPCNELSSVSFKFIHDTAFDKAGNIYVTGIGQGSQNPVGEIIGGCHAKTIKVLKLAISNPYFIEVDASGNIDIEDTTAKPFTIDQFHPKSTQPFNVVTLSGSGSQAPSITGFVLNKSNSTLWASSQEPSSVGAVLEYAFPAGGSPVAEFTCPASCEYFSGVATIPAQVPGP